MLDFFKTKIAIWQKNISLKAVALYLKFLSFFHRKKTEKSFIYPYSLIETLKAFPELQISNYAKSTEYKRLFKLLAYLRKFTLIGDNWLEHDEAVKKPIAMLWGFNDWKWGFVSDYLPEYRTVFTPRKFLNIGVLKAVYKFPEKPSVFIVWGYTESVWVRLASRLFEIPIYRMEDGFVRSVELGAKHSTPYSLVLDKTGLYYNGYQESDLENILNRYNFQNDVNIISASKECIDMLIEESISKYNPPIPLKENEIPLTNQKIRILVIGQVDNDASLRYGNPYKYTMEQIVKIAKYENPLADILYRPHPEVYKGFQKSKFRQNKIIDFAKIVPPDVSLPEILKTIDHVYVITSLAGMEALLRDIPVTVFGTPFYAGWGLTDDRVPLKRRLRNLTKLELFAGVYLKYPRYLADIENTDIGFMASCLRIHGDREIVSHEKAMEVIKEKDLSDIDNSPYWFAALLALKDDDHEKALKLLYKIDYSPLFAKNSTSFFKLTFIYMICGFFKKIEYIDKFLWHIRKYIDKDIFTSLLKNLHEYYPSDLWIKYDIFCYEIEDKDSEAFECLYDYISDNHEKSEEQKFINILENDVYRIEMLKKTFTKHFEMKQFDKAIIIGHHLLLEGQFNPTLLLNFSQISYSKFDFKSMHLFAYLIRVMQMPLWARYAIFTANHDIVGVKDIKKLLPQLALQNIMHPSGILNTGFIIQKHSRIIDNFGLYYNSERLEKVLLVISDCEYKLTQPHVMCYLMQENFEKAFKILQAFPENEKNTHSYKILYARVLSYIGFPEQAIRIINSLYEQRANTPNTHEKLRLSILLNNYEQAEQVLYEAEYNKIEVGDMFPRKIYFGTRQVGKAFFTFTQMALTESVQLCYPDYYVRDYTKDMDEIVLLNIFGPGDEIRFASIYNILPAYLSVKKIIVCCEPKLYSLFQRSCPHIEFVPVQRWLRPYDNYDIENYKRLPYLELRSCLDNNGVEKIEHAKNLMMLTDMLHVCLPDYEAFPGKAYLQPNKDLVENFVKRLSAFRRDNNLLVGISWRSSLSTYSRNEHYLTIEELEPLFKIPYIQFINLQYDECSEELAWVEQRYPGKLYNFPDLDHYNDLESVSALMSCLDLMIAPATTVVELAGALGCPTWLLSNSSELYWRKIDDKGTDVWHNSITHIEGILGDKESLVKNVEVCLRELLKNTQKINHFVA